MSAIFISHSSRDNDAAQAVTNWLTATGHRSVFLDFDPEVGIPAGRDWEQELYQRIRECRAVIVICSRHSMASRWCFMEITHARALGKHLFPLRIDDTEIDGVLADHQVIDLTAEQVTAFAQLERGLVAAGLDPADVFDWDGSRPPYPGLLSFQEEDAGIFFGRDREIGAGLDLLGRVRRLGSTPLAMVLGASGAGKSSLVRAGLIPRLRRDRERWIVINPFRPRSDPVRGLAAALSRAFEKVGCDRPRSEIESELRAAVGESGDGGGNPLIATVEDLKLCAERDDARVLVTIDQFEELLGQPPEHVSSRLLALIRDAIEGDDSALLILGTMRSDFLGQFQQHPALVGLESSSLPLGPMPVGDIAQVIAKPAKVAGLDLEDGLVEEMTADAETDDALPLLAFALRELYERYGGDRRLDLDDYRLRLGGLQGAIAEVAEELLASQRLAPHEEDDLRRAFLAMVRIGEDGGYAREPASWDATPPGSHGLLERFVQARLLVAYGDSEERVVEVAHEALFRSWDRLREWLDESAAALSLQRDVSHSAFGWHDSGRSDDDLWRGGRLALARDLVDSGELPIDALTQEFVEEGERAERAAAEAGRLRRRRLTWVGVAVVALLVTGAIAFAINEQTNSRDLRATNMELDSANRNLDGANTDLQTKNEELDIANQNLGAANTDLIASQAAEKQATDQAQLAAVEALTSASLANVRLGGFGDLDALLQAVRARQALDSVETPPDELTDEVTLSLNGAVQAAHLQNVLEGLSGRVLSVVVSADSTAIGAADELGNVVVWDDRGSRLTSFTVPGGAVWDLDLSPDLARVAAIQTPEGTVGASGSTLGSLAVYDIDGSEVRVVHEEPGFVASRVGFGEDAETIATESEGVVRWWDLDGPRSVPGAGDPFAGDLYRSLQGSLIGPNGSSASAEPPLFRFSTASGESIDLDTGAIVISAWAFKPDGLLVVGLRSGTVQIWNPSSATPPPVQLDAPFSWELAVSADFIYFAESGGAVSAWSPDNQLIARWQGPDGSRVPSVAVGPAGDVLALGEDRSLYYWADGDLDHDPQVTEGPFDVRHIGFGADGGPQVTLVETDRVVVRDLAGTELLRSPPLPEIGFLAVASPRADSIVVTDADGSLSLVAADGTVSPLVGHPQRARDAVFTSDGDRFATSSIDGALQVWTDDGQLIARFVLPGNAGTTIAWGPDGDTIAAADDTGKVRVWNVSNETQVRELSTGEIAAPWSLGFSPDGRLLALATSSRNLLWTSVDIDSLTVRACAWLSDYLATSPAIADEERELCAPYTS